MTQEPLNTKGADIALSIEKILTKLTVCLNQETEAVVQNNRDAANALQEKKIQLMEEYRSLSERLDRDQSVLENLDDSVREHLKTISAEFREALAENSQAIKSAHNAVTRLMDRIMTTARRTIMEGQQQYNAKGALTGGNATGGIIPTKLNEEL